MIPYGDGPSGEIRTPGILNPNQAHYQLGHTRIITIQLDRLEIFVPIVVK